MNQEALISLGDNASYARVARNLLQDIYQAQHSIDYEAVIDLLAEEIAEIVEARMRGLIKHKVINPITSHAVQYGVSELVEWAKGHPLLQTDEEKQAAAIKKYLTDQNRRISGVAAGDGYIDEEEIKGKKGEGELKGDAGNDELKRDSAEEKKAEEPEIIVDGKGIPGSEGWKNSMLFNINANKTASELFGIQSANASAMTGGANTAIAGGIMLDPTILGAYGARNAITGAVRTTGPTGLALAGAGALGAVLYPSTEFISNNMILDDDFNEMMSNPFLSPSAKAQLFEKAQLDIKQQNVANANKEEYSKQTKNLPPLPFSDHEDLGQIYTPLPEPKKPSILYTPLIERGPNILTTPGEEKKPIVLVTPEYETPSWHQLPGYGVYDGTDLSLLFRKGSGGKSKSAFNKNARSATAPPSMPPPEELEEKGKKKEPPQSRKCEAAESKIWNKFKNHKVIKGKQTKTNGLQGKNRRYYQWDDWHKEIEVYDNKGKPLEVLDPVEGEVIPKSVKRHKDLSLK